MNQREKYFSNIVAGSIRAEIRRRLSFMNSITNEALKVPMIKMRKHPTPNWAPQTGSLYWESDI